MPPSPNASTDDLLHLVLRDISRHNLLTPGHRVLVAVSGGPDSVALLHLMLRIAPAWNLTLGVAHLHHGLRGAAADRDAEFVETLAQKLHLPCHRESGDAAALRRREGLSPEEAARKLRHDFLRRVRQTRGYDRVALGHHADDNAELLLLRLLQGTGPTGMAGMAPTRGDGIIRPLLYANRADIEAFLRAENLSWRIDASNADERFPRNRIRQRLLPRLRAEFNPEVTAALNRYAELRRDEEEWLSALTAELTDRCVLSAGEVNLSLSVPALRKLPRAARRRVLRAGLEKVRGHLRRISMDHVAAALDLIDGDGRHRRRDLPGRLRVARTGDELRIHRISGHPRAPEPGPPEYRYWINGPGALELPEIHARLTLSVQTAPVLDAARRAGQWVAFFDMRKVRFPLVVRNARPGDRFTPLGMSGTQKVAEFLVNQKVPAPDRPRRPVLLSGDRIIWVAGHRVDEAVKLTPSTESALKAEIFLV
jgi:tRNA(Ile)-lysidine synthase